MTQQGLWPQRTNKLVAAAEECGVNFTTVPPEGEGVLTAVAGCLAILNIDPQKVLERIKEDPQQRLPEIVVVWALWDVAWVLFFTAYPDDRSDGDGEGLPQLDREATNTLRQHLKVIVARKGVMERIDKLHVVQPTQGRNGIGVGEIIRGHAKKEFIA